eukprot:Lithocolla_globosa_v1_NODE_4961_length_1328_cov_16.739984.p2 type:complete len:112 gc:universal NODE_4961_length_1328_cov_16.739984:1119-784(-)
MGATAFIEANRPAQKQAILLVENSPFWSSGKLKTRVLLPTESIALRSLYPQVSDKVYTFSRLRWGQTTWFSLHEFATARILNSSAFCFSRKPTKMKLSSSITHFVTEKHVS